MRRMLALLCCAAAAIGLSVAVSAAASATGTASLPNSHPGWATPGNKVATAAPDSRIGFSVYLKMRDQAGAEAAAAAVSEPEQQLVRSLPEPGAGTRAVRRDRRHGPVGAAVAQLGGVHGWRDGFEQRLYPGQRNRGADPARIRGASERLLGQGTAPARSRRQPEPAVVDPLVGRVGERPEPVAGEAAEQRGYRRACHRPAACRFP